MVKYLDLKRINDSFQPDLSRAVNDVVESGWYLLGEKTHEFEREYASYIGVKHAVGCGNGLDALTLILRAYKELGVVKDGDEVIVPANTYIASILAISECGLRPVLVEPNPATFQIDENKIEKAITDKTVAIMIVHLYGMCAYTDKIAQICKKYNLKLIEDNAQAHGCRFENRLTGALGDAAGHSFYPGKNLGALGDAGMVTTDDEELATMVRRIGNYGSEKKYVFQSMGRNSRMDEIQAASLLVKLPRLDADNQIRRDIARRYLGEIKNAQIILPRSFADAGEGAVYHVFPVLCARRDELQGHLANHGVGTMIHYPIPPHMQACYMDSEALKKPANLTVTENIHEQELSLPIYPGLTKEEIDTVIEAINIFQ